MSKNRVYLMAIGFVVTFTAGLVIKQALIPGIALLLVAGVIGWFVIQD